VANPVELQTTVESAAIGQVERLTIMRDGKRQELKLKAEEQPNDFGLRGKPMANPARRRVRGWKSWAWSSERWMLRLPERLDSRASRA